MKLARVHAYEIRPQRMVENPIQPAGGIIEPTAELRGVLEELVESSRLTEQTEICFKTPTEANGKSKHQVREEILAFCFRGSKRSEEAGKSLAERLSRSMDKRSQGFLLVASSFKDGDTRRLTIWAFPRDEAFQFQAASAAPVVTVLNDVFSRSSRLRKAAVFEGTKSADDFWSGRVNDMQAS
ncbi:MAG: hypothetical protein AAF907_03065, partial [Planctomycetota bacterium]